MQRLRLGVSGPEVSRMGLGTMGLGGRYEKNVLSDSKHVELIRDALALGINFFDSAEVYAHGHAEELLGEAILGRRANVVVSTKFEARKSRHADVIAAAEGSLRRLQTDYIDIYQGHWPNPSVPLADTAAALERLWRDGKIRYVGLSNTASAEARQMRQLLPVTVPMVAMQQEYNLSERFVEYRLLPLCRELGMDLVACSPMAQGRLGRLSEGTEAALLNRIASDYSFTPLQMALAWVIRQPNTLPLCMTSSLIHLEANVAAVERASEIAASDILALSDGFVRPTIEVPTDAIDVVEGHTGRVFHTLDEALDNTLGMSPSPRAFAETLKETDLLKPVKLRRAIEEGRYELFEGQLRYWAWVIAHDGRKPIAATLHPGKIE